MSQSWWGMSHQWRLIYYLDVWSNIYAMSCFHFSATVRDKFLSDMPDVRTCKCRWPAACRLILLVKTKIHLSIAYMKMVDKLNCTKSYLSKCWLPSITNVMSGTKNWLNVVLITGAALLYRIVTRLISTISLPSASRAKKFEIANSSFYLYNYRREYPVISDPLCCITFTIPPCLPVVWWCHFQLRCCCQVQPSWVSMSSTSFCSLWSSYRWSTSSSC